MNTTAWGWLSLLVLTVALLNGCDDPANGSPVQTDTIEAVKVEVVKVRPAEMRDVLVLPGQTEAVRDVTVASEREGRVEWIGPTEGEEVTVGELLMEIDVETAKANLNRAVSEFLQADRTAYRRRFLHKGGIVAKEDFENIRTEREVALTRVFENLVPFRQCFLRAPMSGIVDKLFVDPGEFVNRGQAVMELVDVNTIRVNVNVPEMDVRYFKTGQKSRVTIDAYPQSTWEGTIDLVSFKADPVTKTFKVRALVENADRRIRPGMVAHVALLRKTVSDAVAAPLFAIVDRGGERIVFVEEDGIAKARVVDIGIIDEHRAQILKGLKPGDKLITTGAHDIEEGMRVSVQ